MASGLTISDKQKLFKFSLYAIPIYSIYGVYEVGKRTDTFKHERLYSSLIIMTGVGAAAAALSQGYRGTPLSRNGKINLLGASCVGLSGFSYLLCRNILKLNPKNAAILSGTIGAGVFAALYDNWFNKPEVISQNTAQSGGVVDRMI